jgi:hypothetical protein
MYLVPSDTKRNPILARYDPSTIDKRIPILHWSGQINYTSRPLKLSEIGCLETSGFAYQLSHRDILEHVVQPPYAQWPHTFLWVGSLAVLEALQ